MADRVRLLVLYGPTASGKTALAVALAKRLGGEVISADSMQIYQGLTVGTAAPTEQEMQGVPHHLIGVIPPTQAFSVADWVQCAEQKIQKIVQRKGVPIVAGGTGLYLSSLLHGVRFEPQKPDERLRQKLQHELSEHGAQAMLERLREKDPAYAAGLHPNDTVRVLRALERIEQTGATVTQQLMHSRMEQPPYDADIWGLVYPTRAALYEVIEQRIEHMLTQGLLREAYRVYVNRESFRTAAQAIGYKEFFDYFENRRTRSECVAALKQATRRYAKRQLTWLRQLEGIRLEKAADLTAAERIAHSFEGSQAKKGASLI